MANIKISELTALTPPDAADLVPVTDSSASQTKRTTVGEIVGIVNGDVAVANDGTATISELPVSKLADGAARQLLQTDAAGTGVEWTDNVDVPGTLDVTGATTLDSTLGVDGQSTLASAAVSDLTEDRVVIAGASGELEDSANLTFDGSELGITGTLDVSSNGTIGGDLTVVGDLTVEGATTTLETQTVTVEDKNIELGVVDTPTDTTADGGGITLKGATDKTINWVNATDAWTSSEHIELASGKEFYIDGNGVLNATTLGSGVVNSSLTSVGTIATGTWEGDVIDAAYLDATVVTTSDTGKVTSTMISDGTIVNDDVNASAAIAGTKIDPDFGSQTVETTGVFSAAGGAEATPSIAFTGDLNTGIYSPGADQLAISTSGTGRLFVDASGNVGLGTSSPATTLDVNGNVTITDKIIHGGDTNTAIRFPAADTFAVETAGTERLRVDSSGNVGIGTTSPGVALHVDGDIRCDGVYGETDTDTSIKFPGSDVITFNEGGSEAARIDSSGRLLVGTSSNTDDYNFQVDSASSKTAQFTRYGSDGAEVVIGSSRGTQGSKTALNDGDYAGLLTFKGYDGSNFQTIAWVGAQCDGQSPASGDSPGRLVFSTTADGASSPTEQLRITSDRYVRLASGSGGIQFNGDTAAANALDDYEEGTHTATATCSTSGTVTLDSTNNKLAYTKIGKLVSVHGRVSVSAISSPTGNLTLSLPFVAADLDDSAGRSAGSINIRLVAATYDVGLFSCYLDEGSSNLAIAYGGSTDIVAAAPAITASTQIWISITYRTT